MTTAIQNSADQPKIPSMWKEEPHNLFPKKNESDLTPIYNRIAKEGAKLNLGLVYATQEVSSTSANVLKNTQNWFVSHLNNGASYSFALRAAQVCWLPVTLPCWASLEWWRS
jgi:hypothetical protein